MNRFKRSFQITKNGVLDRLNKNSKQINMHHDIRQLDSVVALYQINLRTQIKQNVTQY